MHKNVRVIDNYFPDWTVKRISHELEVMPVTYTNSPYRDFERARFFGSSLMEYDEFKDIKPWWFVEYFNQCVYNDIETSTVGHCCRVLLNAQLPGMNGCNHCDADTDEYLTIIYMGHGQSGDTVFVDPADNEMERVSFKEGRLVIFPSHIWHRGEAPSHGYRVSLGAVYPVVPIDALSTNG